MAATDPHKEDARPISPHLQVYRWPVTMLTSILHRATGFGNAIGTLLLATWLISAASGEGAYDQFSGFMGSMLGRLILFGFTLSLTYHLLNGIRHLFWDTGMGFEKSTARASGISVIVLALVGTVAIWVIGYWIKGGAA